MNFTNLSAKEINILIHSEKHPKSILVFNDVYNQIETKLVYTNHTYQCEINDLKRKIIYDLHVHTTPSNTHFSIGLMFQNCHYHLIRFDFGDNLRHTNNYGTDNEYEVIGSHVHINTPPDKYTPKNVIPIDSIDEFKNIKIIKDAFLEFLKYTNIKK